jgi:uncharacterized protein YegP (UPF0339 family)
MKSYFSLKSGENGEFYFNLKAPNHEIILQSEGYKQKQGAKNGIESVQENSKNEEQYERLISDNGKPYFVLKAKNGEIIGVSEMYESSQAMENGIRSVIKNGQTSEIIDLTDDDDDDHGTVEIIVNGRPKQWSKKLISFEEVVVLAFGSYNNNPNVCYTITYSKGYHSKPEGSMVKGQEVKVKRKMIFNVTATDKS